MRRRWWGAAHPGPAHPRPDARPRGSSTRPPSCWTWPRRTAIGGAGQRPTWFARLFWRRWTDRRCAPLPPGRWSDSPPSVTEWGELDPRMLLAIDAEQHGDTDTAAAHYQRNLEISRQLGLRSYEAMA